MSNSLTQCVNQLTMLTKYNDEASREWYIKNIAKENNKNVLGVTLNYKNMNNFFKELTQRRLPEIQILSIQNIKEANYEELRKFLRDSFPIKLKKFELEFSFMLFFDINLILNELKAALRWLTWKLRIYRASLNNKSLSQLIRDSSHLEIVIFWSCNIEIDNNLRFDSDVKYNIKSLKFYFSPDNRAEFNQEIAENVVWAISKSSFSESLKYIWFDTYAGVDKKYMKELLQKFSLNNLVVKKMF